MVSNLETARWQGRFSHRGDCRGMAASAMFWACAYRVQHAEQEKWRRSGM
jgi:hypothetical protein